MTDKERLEEIKYILNSPGEVFFGSISEDGVVSQDVADAEPYFKWLIEQAEKNMTCQEVLDLQKDALKGLLEQNKRYREALNNIITLWIASTDATDDTWLDHEMSETESKALEDDLK